MMTRDTVWNNTSLKSEMQQVAAKPSPAPTGIRVRKSPRSGNPRGDPRVFPDIGEVGVPRLFSNVFPPRCSHQISSYLHYCTAYIHAYLKLFYTDCSVTCTCNINLGHYYNSSSSLYWTPTAFVKSLSWTMKSGTCSLTSPSNKNLNA